MNSFKGILANTQVIRHRLENRSENPLANPAGAGEKLPPWRSENES